MAGGREILDIKNEENNSGLAGIPFPLSLPLPCFVRSFFFALTHFTLPPLQTPATQAKFGAPLLGLAKSTH